MSQQGGKSEAHAPRGRRGSQRAADSSKEEEMASNEEAGPEVAKARLLYLSFLFELLLLTNDDADGRH